MNIAFFHELTPLSGARKVVEEYGKILSKNHQVDLFYVDYAEDKKIVKIFSKIYFFKFGFSGGRKKYWTDRLRIDSIELVKLYFLHIKISKIVKANNYDLVFVNPSKYTQAPFLLKFIDRTVYFCQEPLRIAYDDFLEIPENINSVKKIYEKLNRKIRKFIDRSNIKRADIVLANSLFSKENIRKAYGIRASLCYLGVNTDKFYPLSIKKAYDLLFVGEKVDIEGYDLLKATLALYKKPPTVEFVFRNKNGSGVNEEVLVNKINKSKIILALSKNEPFGLIPIEAMACEIPVIAVNEGGLCESVVNGRTGFLVDRDPRDLKDKIDSLLGDSNLRNKLGKAGRNRVVANFTWKASLGNFLNLTKKIYEK